MVFIIALTIAIDDIPKVSATDSPVALVLRDQLGVVMERSLLIAITFAFFGAGLVTLATCARMIFAMARDKRFPAHRLMRQVDAPHEDTHTRDHPARDRRVRSDGGAARATRCSNFSPCGGVIGSSLYGGIIVLYLGVRKRLGHQEDAFDLGRFETARRDRRTSVVGIRGVSSSCRRRRPFTSVLITIGILIRRRRVFRIPAHCEARSAGERARRNGSLQTLTETPTSSTHAEPRHLRRGARAVAAIRQA